MPALEERTITVEKNGIYEVTPNEGYNGIVKLSVNVNVQEGVVPIDKITITSPIGEFATIRGYGYKFYVKFKLNDVTTNNKVIYCGDYTDEFGVGLSNSQNRFFVAYNGGAVFYYPNNLLDWIECTEDTSGNITFNNQTNQFNSSYIYCPLYLGGKANLECNFDLAEFILYYNNTETIHLKPYRFSIGTIVYECLLDTMSGKTLYMKKIS